MSEVLTETTIRWFLTHDADALLRLCRTESILPNSRILVLTTVGVHATRDDATRFADAMMGDSVPYVRAEAAALLSTLTPAAFLVESLDHGYRLRD